MNFKLDTINKFESVYIVYHYCVSSKCYLMYIFKIYKYDSDRDATSSAYARGSCANNTQPSKDEVTEIELSYWQRR